MDFGDVLLLAIRWVHALAAVAWVGGGMFYFLVLRPNMKRWARDSEDSANSVGQQFRNVVNTAMGVLLVSGVILTFSRLTSSYTGLAYVLVLSAKIVLAMYMFYLVRFLRARTYPSPQPNTGGRLHGLTALFTNATTVLVLGVVVFLLADVLGLLVEEGIKG